MQLNIRQLQSNFWTLLGVKEEKKRLRQNDKRAEASELERGMMEYYRNAEKDGEDGFRVTGISEGYKFLTLRTASTRDKQTQ